MVFQAINALDIEGVGSHDMMDGMNLSERRKQEGSTILTKVALSGPVTDIMTLMSYGANIEISKNAVGFAIERSQTMHNSKMGLLVKEGLLEKDGENNNNNDHKIEKQPKKPLNPSKPMKKPQGFKYAWHKNHTEMLLHEKGLREATIVKNYLQSAEDTAKGLMMGYSCSVKRVERVEVSEKIERTQKSKIILQNSNGHNVARR